MYPDDPNTPTQVSPTNPEPMSPVSPDHLPPEPVTAGSFEPHHRRSKKRIVIILVVIVVLLLAIGVTMALGGNPDETDNSTTDTPTNNFRQTDSEHETEDTATTRSTPPPTPTPSPAGTQPNEEINAKARDTERVTDINTIHMKLEEFHNENTSYPKTFTAATLPDIDGSALVDPDGNSIIMSAPAANQAAANMVANPTGTNEYKYIPYHCVVNDCTGYVLKTFIEKPSSVFPNPYVKLGLNNN